MKNFILAFSVLALLFACEEYEDPCDVPTSFTGLDEAKLQQDIDSIDNYLAQNNIQATVHPTGIRYIIKKEGSGRVPNICDFVVVGYKGKFLDGTIFDKTPDNDVSRFLLENLVKGWQVGIPLIKPGGEITLYIPSPLGFADATTGAVPPNSILIFDVILYTLQ